MSNHHNLVVVEIEVGLIDCEDRIRPANEDTVAGLQVDIAERGLRSPIEVSEAKDGRYRLVAGLHRLTAVRNLGQEKIPAFVRSGCVDDLTLDELLENITRQDLSPLDQTLFAARLQALLSKGKGGDRRSEDFQTVSGTVWSEEAAKRTGWAASTIEKRARIGSRLAPETVAAIRGTSLAKSQKELEALSKFSPPIQENFVRVLTRAERPAQSVAAAQRELSGTPQPKDKSKADGDLQRLLDLWDRSSKATRDAFLEKIGAKIGEAA